MKILIFVSTFLLISVMLISCKKDNPIPPSERPQLNLTLEDVSCTEAWINLKLTNLSLPVEAEIFKDSVPVETITLASADTVLYIDSLLPNNTYSLEAIIQSLNQPITSSDLQVVTMDTTNHNFTWQTWTFGGQAGSCELYDVAIINENDIWAVGEIYLLDSLGQTEPQAYNAVHWNGSLWEIIKIKTKACGGVDYPPVDAIFLFSSSDILFAHIDGSISYYNGIEFTNDCSLITQLNGSANKIWGVSRNNFYVVSGNGFIAQYQNGTWSKIESGTEANIGDIWAVPDGSGGYNKYLAADNKLLKIDENDNLSQIIVQQGMILNSVWGNSERLIYTAGNGVVLYKNNAWEKIENQGVNSVYRIRGVALNEIYGISSPGNIIKYFNGYTWHTISTEPNNRYWRIETKGNLIAATGYNGDAAIVTIFIKN